MGLQPLLLPYEIGPAVFWSPCKSRKFITEKISFKKELLFLPGIILGQFFERRFEPLANHCPIKQHELINDITDINECVTREVKHCSMDQVVDELGTELVLHAIDVERADPEILSLLLGPAAVEKIEEELEDGGVGLAVVEGNADQTALDHVGQEGGLEGGNGSALQKSCI